MQAQHMDKLEFKGFGDCIEKLYKQKGPKSFYKALGVTLLRAVPVNSVAFLTYEMSMRKLGWKV